MDRAWRLASLDDAACDRLARDLGVRSATARCLAARGLGDPSRAGAFLRPRLGDLRAPAGMAGFSEAVERLTRAVLAGDRVGIFGDYDVDGVSAAAVLASFLRGSGGAAVEVEVARRADGYGFGPASADALLERGASPIVTLDCGTSDAPAILRCRARGVDVIVVDHHQVPPGGAHPAYALVNPHRIDSAYPFRGLASVGLAFFLAAATRTALRAAGWFAARPEPDVRELLDLVAIGTVGDMAPLVDENRVLVAAGLRELSARRRPGLAALLARASVAPTRALDEVDIGWRISPRLNAPGRLGEARPALELLLATDAGEGDRLAALCDEANARRRALQDRVLEEALREAEATAADGAITVAGRGWHPGVVGIVAAKLADRFGLPSAVIALDEATGEGRGSVRSAGRLHVFRALERCGEHLLRFGGHAEAGGFAVAAARVDDLRRAFAAAANAEAGASARRPLEVDALVELDQVDETLVAELGALGPFGAGNPEPVLALAGARVRSTRRLGEHGTHLRLVLESPRTGSTVTAIGFGLADRDPGPGAHVDVAFRPEVSSWQGLERLELKLRDLRPAAGVLS